MPVRLAAALFAWLMILPVVPAFAEFIPVQAFPIPLNSLDTNQKRIGGLIYRGGLVLKSTQRAFGGLSALDVGPTGRYMLAISDAGFRLIMELAYAKNGDLDNVVKADLSNLGGPDREPLSGEADTDAESLAVGPDGSVVIAFEQNHRLMHYPYQGPPQLMAPPPGLGNAPANSGIEALTVLADGRLLAITEDDRTADRKAVAAWAGSAHGWIRLSYATTGAFKPTGAATLPDGDVILLQRAFGLVNGAAVRISRIKAADIKPGARLTDTEIARWRAPLTVDNFEGIGVRRSTDGKTLVYLVSDDNFNILQRTLLLMFELVSKTDGG